MIIIKVRNGLGNQLFIYAFGFFLKEKHPGQDIKFDFSELPCYINGRKTYQFNDVFDIQLNELSSKEVRFYYGRLFYFKRPKSECRNFFDRVKRKIARISSGGKKMDIILEPDYWDIPQNFIDSMVSFTPEKSKIYLFVGFWENMDYILPYKDKICDSLKFNKGVVDKFWEEQIYHDKETVAVHIRRGDYIIESIQKELPKNIYTICDQDYYKEAMKYIEERVLNPHFVFFTDDPAYVEKEFSSVKNKSIIRGNKDYEDLYLMTLCKHHIIANSTFSFWGAFLKKQKGIVIAPRIHYIRVLDENTKVEKEFFRSSDWIYLNNA